MDGDIDYSKYTWAELREALERIRADQYPRNFANLNTALLQMSSEQVAEPHLYQLSLPAPPSIAISMFAQEQPVNRRILLPLKIGATALLGYPFVAIADVMSIGGGSGLRDDSVMLVIARGGFLYGTLGYPVVFAVAAITAFALRDTNPVDAYRWSLAPLCYIGLMLLFMVGWLILDH